ncbi:MAG TPA: ABC transporter substrate-binding protein [Candidatus Limnocylindria bacterium]|nr:ABC transporter substrate-binding protein [Candidatus Limnocylindria bacterium]
MKPLAFGRFVSAWFVLLALQGVCDATAAEKLIGFHSARTMSQAMPWIAEEAGLFRKYDLDFQLVYISSAPIVTAALLGGDAQVAVSGGEAIVRAHAQGATDLVFVGSAKNTLTHSIVSKAEIKRPEDLKGKKLGLTRLGANSHYFIIHALRKYGMEPSDINFIQTGGQVENLAALLSGNVDAATMTGPSGGARATAQGYRYLIYGPDLHIPFAAATLITRRSILKTRAPAIDKFVRATAEAMKIMFLDKEFTYRVLGKQLRINDRKILDAAYDEEIKVLERRLEFKNEAFQAIIDETGKVDPRAKKIRPQDLVDRRFIDGLQKSGFFDKLWAGK